jgi:hypothetical protein
MPIPAELARITQTEISEAVAELGLLYKGIDRNGNLCFERPYGQTRSREPIDVIAWRCTNILRDVSQESASLTQLFSDKFLQGIKIF